MGVSRSMYVMRIDWMGPMRLRAVLVPSSSGSSVTTHNSGCIRSTPISPLGQSQPAAPAPLLNASHDEPTVVGSIRSRQDATLRRRFLL